MPRTSMFETLEPPYGSAAELSRPLSNVSTGHVAHHIAGESLRVYQAAPAHQGSAAELVDPSSAPSSQGRGS